MAVYMINCLYRIQSALTLYDDTDQRVEMLEAQMEAHLDTVVHHQVTHMLTKGGFLNVVGLHQEWAVREWEARFARRAWTCLTASVVQARPDGMLSHVAGMDPSAMRRAVAAFDAYLAEADTALLGPCEMLLR